MKIADLLRRDDGGSAAIRQAIERAETAGREATARVDALTRQRAEALLADDERSLDRIEALIAQARRDADRADLALIELERRLAETETAERAAALDAVHARGLAAQKKAVGLLREYGKLAAKMAALLGELRELDGVVAAVNLELGEARDPRQLVEPDRLARPLAPGTAPVLSAPVYDAARLPHPTDPALMLWPSGVDVDGFRTSALAA